MSKTIKISPEVHAIAKKKAERSGIKLYRFIEMAIKAFSPNVQVLPDETRRDRRNAG